MSALFTLEWRLTSGALIAAASLAVIFVGFPDNNMLIVVVRRKHEQADVKFHWLPRLCVN
jgi:hypothetical protein